MSFSQPLPTQPARLLTMLNDQDSVSRERAAYALGRISPETEEILLALGEALFDTDDEVCIAAAISLFGCGNRSKPALPQLMKALQHRDVNVRCLVIATLGSIGPDAREALPVLIEQSKNPDPRIRGWSTQALRSIGLDSEKTEQETS